MLGLSIFPGKARFLSAAHGRLLAAPQYTLNDDSRHWIRNVHPQRQVRAAIVLLCLSIVHVYGECCRSARLQKIPIPLLTPLRRLGSTLKQYGHSSEEALPGTGVLAHR